MKKKLNLSSVVAIILVLSLAVGSIALSFDGQTKVVVEGDYIEASGSGENLGALASPYIYTPLYAFAGLTVETGFTITSGGQTVTDGNLTVSSGVATISGETATSTLVENVLTITRKSGTGYGTDGIGSGFLFKAYDSAGNATNTARMSVVMDDVTSGSDETSIIFEQLLDNGVALTNVFEIDSGNGDFNYNLNVDGDLTTAGNINVNGGLVYDTDSNATGDPTVTLTSDSDNIQFITASSSATAYTLPAATDGLWFQFVVTGALTGVSTTTVSSAEGDNITGTLSVDNTDVDCSAEDKINIQPSYESIGDNFTIISDGTSWFITSSEAATALAFTCTDPS